MRLFALSSVIALFTTLGASAFFDVSSSLQNILRNTERSDRYHYPTDFTRDIIPVWFNWYSVLAYVIVNRIVRNHFTATMTIGEIGRFILDFRMELFPLKQMCG